MRAEYVALLAAIVAVVLMLLKGRRRHRRRNSVIEHTTLKGKPIPVCANPLAKPNPVAIVESPNPGYPVCPASETVDLSVPGQADLTASNGIFIFSGTGQYGAVSPYFAMAPYFPSIAGNITLQCGAQSSHRVHYVLQAIGVPVTSSPPSPSATSVTVTWAAQAGVEEYAVQVFGQKDSRNHFYGGSTIGTSLTVPIESDMMYFTASVIGYKLCDKSPLSNPTNFST